MCYYIEELTFLFDKSSKLRPMSLYVPVPCVPTGNLMVPKCCEHWVVPLLELKDIALEYREHLNRKFLSEKRQIRFCFN